MTLPYLATALLILVTLYSAFLSFREKPEIARPAWLFPSRSRLVTRIVAVLATLLLVLAFALWFRVGSRSSSRSVRFLIPENYTGWVRVEFDISGAPALPVEDGETIARIPSSGKLSTSSPEQFGVSHDQFFYYSGVNERQIPRSGPGRMIWGKINGEETNAAGKREYEEFFVGGEKQFMDQAKSGVSPP
jgi:hypothetical protein